MWASSVCAHWPGTYGRYLGITEPGLLFLPHFIYSNRELDFIKTKANLFDLFLS